MMCDAKAISKFAYIFKNHDPQLYEKFLRVLDAYAFDVTAAVTEARKSSDLQRQAGQAQMARKFLQMFSEPIDPSAP